MSLFTEEKVGPERERGREARRVSMAEPAKIGKCQEDHSPTRQCKPLTWPILRGAQNRRCIDIEFTRGDVCPRRR